MSIHQLLLQMMVKVLEKCLEQQQSITLNLIKISLEKEAYLTVTGQLHVEAFALTYRDVYTFGPAFRAENSNTSRHASEFWMIEPEIAFADLEDDMDLIEDMVKYCIDYVLDNAPEEMKFFESMIDKDCINRIKAVRDSDFKRMTYTEAIDYLLKADVKFENKVE